MTIMQKANFVGKVFIGGVKEQLSQEWTWGAAALVGLSQGLKYKGSIKLGIQGGLATLVVIAGANGAYNVVSYWDKIKLATSMDI